MRDAGSTGSKVGRGIEKYGLEGLGPKLEARWTGERGERTSLRDLADFFNRRLLEAAIEDAGGSALPPDVEATYEALTDEGVSRGVRTEVRRDLEQRGVDVAQLEDDFVTHQAMHTYLTEYRGAEYTADTDREQVSTALETIQRLKSRTVAVVENTLERLRRTDRLATGNLEVLVDVRVTCTDCGTQYDVTTLLESGGCECDEE